MEFPFFTNKALGSDAEGFAVIDGGKANAYRRPGGGGQGLFGGGASASTSPEQ